MLEHVINRVKKSKLLDEIIVAIPDEDSSYSIIPIATDCGVLHYIHPGDENNVLDRFYYAATGKIIVRITADCPLIDPEVIDSTIRHYLNNDYDYVYNLPAFPDGLDVEVFSRWTLNKVWEEATSPSDREHVTSYIINNPDNFRIGIMESKRDYSKFHWSVDTRTDLEFVRRVYKKLGENFGFRDVIKLLKEKK